MVLLLPVLENVWMASLPHTGERKVGRVEKNNQCLRRIGKRKADRGSPGKKKLIQEDLRNQERKRV